MQRRVHLLQVVVIFRTDIDAQRQRLGRRRRGHLWHWFQAVLSIHLDSTRRLPVAGLKSALGRAARGEKCRREITVLNADEVFSTLPEARAPLVQTVQFLVKERRNFAALAVVRRNRFHGRWIRYRQITEAAEPGKSRGDGPAVEFHGGFYADYIGMINAC